MTHTTALDTNKLHYLPETKITTNEIFLAIMTLAAEKLTDSNEVRWKTLIVFKEKYISLVNSKVLDGIKILIDTTRLANRDHQPNLQERMYKSYQQVLLLVYLEKHALSDLTRNAVK